MKQDELDRRMQAQRDRLARRPSKTPACEHEWGTAYRSSSGRKVCTKCGFVTDAPFEALGVGER